MHPERAIDYPSMEASILGWFKGYYDCAYVAFHPFYKIDNLDASALDTRPPYFHRSDLPEELSFEHLQEEFEAREALRGLDRDTLQKMEKKYAQIIPWQEILEACSFQSIRELYTALKTGILDARKGEEDEEGCKRLTTYCAENKIFMPSAGQIQTCMEEKLSSIFSRCGLTNVVMSNLWDEDPISFGIGSSIDLAPWHSTFGRNSPLAKVYDRDRNILMITEWDSFFTLICGSRALLSVVPIEACFLEGFWCTENTKHMWDLEENR
ncbi:MAG: DUF2711 family protein [Cyanobacteria bacterium SZAS TMP-1]|nr:DUF2711 family protein [Cyanobacteria bacterium SZAS TMP-1]